jgi:hypothetical protein
MSMLFFIIVPFNFVVPIAAWIRFSKPAAGQPEKGRARSTLDCSGEARIQQISAIFP